ncbi:restriction endonuclease subunit S [Romboutsia sp.]|uniref:restriction endonuclease subunit S n=1 Tax=Romboutsia sp. TaxID=1965302 RepID=UPI003F3849AD
MDRYSEYKDSGVEWIGEIPSQWDVLPMRHILRLIQTGSTPSTSIDEFFDGDIKWFAPGDFSDEKYLINCNRHITKLAIDKNESKLLPKDTVLLVGIGATLGKVAMIKEESAFNQQITGLVTNKKIVPQFLYYWLKMNTNTLLKTSNFTTLPIVNNEFIKSFPTICPSVNEQKIIVHYLDKKTSQIETLISKKEELIETLKASRTKLISETVTKGLDKDVPMKDSGVEWIGEIPSHWDINRLKYICNINPQKSEVKLSKSSQVSFVPMENVSLNTLILDTDKELAEVYGGYTYFKEGDIVFAKVTPCFENGNMAIAKNLTNGVGFGSTELNVLRVDENIIDRKFLYYVIQSDKFKNEAIANMYGVAGLKRISTKFIEDYNILLPSIDEQRKIIEFLNLKTNYIDMIITKTEEQIELLKKAKQKLITEVVTGKIDVTNL